MISFTQCNNNLGSISDSFTLNESEFSPGQASHVYCKLQAKNPNDLLFDVRASANVGFFFLYSICFIVVTVFQFVIFI